MRLIAISLLQFFVITVHAQIIDFVDLEFKQFLVSELSIDTNGDDIYDSPADINGDLEIDMNEAMSITSLGSESFVGIKSLDDINHFTNLQKLNLKSTFALDSVDLSNNLLLEELSLYLKDSIIIIQEFPELRIIDLEIDDEVSEVRINRNSKLEQATFDGGSIFSGIDSLRILDVSENNLSKVEVLFNWANDIDGRKFLANDNNLSEIYMEDFSENFTKQQEHYEVNISNNLLNETSFTGLYPVGSYMDFSNNEFKVIDPERIEIPVYSIMIHDNPLEVVSFRLFDEETDIDTLELENVQEVNFSCSGQIASLTIKDSPDLTRLDVSCGTCDGDLILDHISNEAEMRIFYDSDIHVIGMTGTFDWMKTDANIYVKNSTADSLYFSSAFEFETLHVFNNDPLEYLEIEGISNITGTIGRLNFYDLTNLEQLIIGDFNTATFLNLANCPELNFLDIHAELLNLEYEQLPKLESIKILAVEYAEKFTNLPGLKHFDSRINDKISLELTDLPMLDSLILYGGMLKYFNISNLPSLSSIEMGGSSTWADCHNHPVRSSIVFQDLPSLVSLIATDLCAHDFIINNLPEVQVLELDNIEVVDKPVESIFMINDILV